MCDCTTQMGRLAKRGKRQRTIQCVQNQGLEMSTHATSQPRVCEQHS